MKIKRALLGLAAPIALLTMSGCASNFTAHVSRFQRLPAPQGQTFRVEPTEAQNRGGLEFATYADKVAARMAQLGYRPAVSDSAADLIVQVGYGVDRGQQKVTTTPGFNCGWGGYGGWGGGFGGWGGRGWGGWGGWGGRGWGYGWGDPFYGGCPDVESYTIYSSFLGMTITGADGKRLFEGRARAHSTTDDLTQLVPNLIDAMFTGFPGNSGQDIRITIPAKPKQKS
jgi:hypothetical protein